MDKRYLDFDAMVAEVEQETAPSPVVKYKGVEYTLPIEMPAMVMLKVLRMSKQATIEDEEFVNDIQLIFESLLGDQFDTLLASGILIGDLAILLKGIIRLYQGNAQTPPVTEAVAGETTE